MKHSKKIIVAMLLTMGASSAQAFESTTIDFEGQTLTTGSSTLSEVTIEDVTFKAGTLNGGAASFLISDISTSPNDNILGTYLTNGVNGFSSLEISFANPISQFSFDFKSQATTNWTLTAFDNSDNIIGTSLNISLPQENGDSYGTFGLSSLDSSFSYAILADTQPATPFLGAELVNEVELDNLKYTTISAVPEPSTYALMLGGLGLVGFMAYRRQKTTNA